MTLTQLNNLGFLDKTHLSTCIRKAKANAVTEWEVSFITKLEQKYIMYGIAMYLNRRTATKLLSIAKEGIYD